jgi:D-sedoheptulose 7-phosphate isomerase
MREHIEGRLDAAADALAGLRRDSAALAGVEAAAELLVRTFRSGGRVFSCGNGGSMCDAMHFAQELSGSFRAERAALPAVAIADPAHLTCTANDFGFEQVFARYVEAHARADDVLLAISTSGSSRNVVLAAEAARERGASVVGLTGRQESALAHVSDIEICTPVGDQSDPVQEQHILVIHVLIELVERTLFPDNYAAAR